MCLPCITHGLRLGTQVLEICLVFLDLKGGCDNVAAVHCQEVTAAGSGMESVCKLIRPPGHQLGVSLPDPSVPGSKHTVTPLMFS